MNIHIHAGWPNFVLMPQNERDIAIGVSSTFSNLNTIQPL
jgi:hypothetical protein